MGGALFHLDQSKAFNKDDHYYLGDVLEAAGFGSGFHDWTSAIYGDIRSSVLMNGYLSEPFYIKRSVRQGCLISPLHYVLALEPLLRGFTGMSNILDVPSCGKYFCIRR